MLCTQAVMGYITCLDWNSFLEKLCVVHLWLLAFLEMKGRRMHAYLANRHFATQLGVTPSFHPGRSIHLLSSGFVSVLIMLRKVGSKKGFLMPCVAQLG